MKIADDTFLATLSVNGLNIFPILLLAELYTTKIVRPFLVATCINGLIMLDSKHQSVTDKF